MNTSKGRTALRIILTLLTVLLIGWIFSNSMKNAEKSTAQSSAVQEIIQDAVDTVAPTKEIEVSGHAVRKAAHFSEYALLGFMLFFTCLSYTEKKPWFFVPALIAVVIPFCDEGIQFFSDGRAPAFKDVGIDISGAAAGMLCAFALFLLIRALWRKRRKSSASENT